MTAEEKQQIVSEVLSAIRTNSALITDLTEVQEIPSGTFLELSGGKRISAANLRDAIQEAIVEASVTPLTGRVQTLETNVTNLGNTKFDKTDVVEASGSSSDKVMSQKYVTQLLNALGVRVGNISVSLGTNDANDFYLVFTNDDGQNTSLKIGKATTTKAGLLSAADKTALEDLKEAKITELNIYTGSEDVDIILGNAGMEDAFEITLPKAGSIPTGETDPVAGVMSVQQAQDLEEVVLQVFPLVASITYSNAGTFEKGSSITPQVNVGLTRRGMGVATRVALTTTMRVVDTQGNTPTDFIPLTYDPITQNTSFNISASHKGQTVVLPQQQYKFVNYVYGDVLSEEPESSSIVTHLYAARTLRELSSRTTYSGTLQAGKYFIFGVPGNVTLICRHSETGAIISGCTTGTVQVPRQNNDSNTDLYSYIIVPSSDVAWNFKITNS